jgi:hypothetical protein
MVDQAPPTPEDLRADAHNTLQLAAMAGNPNLRQMLLHAASEFLNMAAELEGATTVVVAPAEALQEFKTAESSESDAQAGEPDPD